MRVKPGLERFVKQHGATILTVLGSAGVVTTSVMAAKATPKAMLLLEDAEIEKDEKLTVLEKLDVLLPPYIPTIIMGTVTIGCIFGANLLNKRQQASLLSAYTVLDRSYKEYMNKVEKLYGEETTKAVEEEIAKDNLPRRRRYLKL